MTGDQLADAYRLERAAASAMRDRYVEQRLDFQKRYPHYTPPPFLTGEERELAWKTWSEANLKLHGIEECRDRWPGHFWVQP